jgi:hypothetical protein
LFTADPTLDGLVRIHMDWERFTIVLDQDIDPQLLYLTIYVDLNYYNNTIIGLDNALDKRMNQNLEQASKEMYMNVPSNTKKE